MDLFMCKSPELGEEFFFFVFVLLIITSSHHVGQQKKVTAFGVRRSFKTQSLPVLFFIPAQLA